ncbi:MAG: NPCBM/NEW2 domain-containing protein [Chloroflexota bacterium]|nr:NPCBM/NEW2 domain-containing protein [Chloroflexota bacterium]MDQ5866622.1 NPCBM/NEW2 domain-containing protein [Chloroflexota bacterium]
MRRYLPALLAALTLFCAWLALSLPGVSTAKEGSPSLVATSTAVAPGTPTNRAFDEPHARRPSSPEGNSPPILPPGFVQVPLLSGLNFPTSFAILPDGRILVAEKSGLVLVYKDGAVLATPMLDLRGQVNDYWERGLIEVAVDPNFETNHYIYVYYTNEPDPNADPASDAYKAAKTNRLARYTVQGDVALTATQKIILGTITGSANARSCNDYPAGSDCLPADGPSHMGGTIKFAPDGSLFLSTGDASDYTRVDDNALRVQSLDSLAGKLIRIDPATGRGLPSNPFWNQGDPDAARSKVWAYGLRNPFRFTFRPDTAVPYIGDVGMNYWEELNIGAPGLNFGWPCYEGPAPHEGYAAKPLCGQLSATAVQTPLLSLDHGTGNRCIVGGTFYTGTTYPEQYRGAYFYGDCTNRYIDYLYVDPNNKLVSGPHRFGYLRYDVSDGTMGGPTKIAMGPDGNLYVLETVFGALSRLEMGEPQAPPKGTSYVSDLAWNSASNGWGVVERDTSNGEANPYDGNPITLNSVTYSKGVGAHANSDVKVYLGKSCTSFSSAIGVDDEVGNLGSVVFEVWADGTRLTQSSVIVGSTPTQSVNVDLTGREELVLSVRDGGDGNAFDHADWADARVTCKGTPSIVSTVPADRASGVLPSTTISVTFNKPMDSATFSGSTVLLTRQGSSTPLSATLGYSPTTHTLFIDPTNDLEAPSIYTVTVKGEPGGVRDVDGLLLYQDAVWSFTANFRPSVVIERPSSDLRVKVGDVVTYTGSATDPENGPLPPSALDWNVLIQHCPDGHCHSHPLQESQGSTGTFVVPDHGDDSYIEVVLTARDNDNLTRSASVEVQPQTVQITLTSSPPGLQLVYDSFVGTTPFTRTAVISSTHSLRALSPQDGHEFQTWLHTGAQNHDVIVGLTNTTYTAVYSTPVPTPTRTLTSTPTSTSTSTPTRTSTRTSTPVASPTAVACNVQFSDVPPGSTFYSFVQCLACRGVLGGYADGTFRPGAGITRGQLAKLVSNAAGYDEDVSGQTFSDVPPGSTFYLYVERIARRGIVGGYGDGTFRPGGPATRGQIAKVLSNAAGFTDSPLRQSFPDVGTGDPFYLYVERLSSRGIIGGYADGTFRPGNPATRGQVSKMVANTFFAECGRD